MKENASDVNKGKEVFKGAGNEQNMKPVQFCTGFIFCTFPEILIAKNSYHMHYRLPEVKERQKESVSYINKSK